MITESMQKAIEIRELMNAPSYYTTNSVSQNKANVYMDYDHKQLAVMEQHVGSISDCFILYAIARLGCASRDAIADFLTILKKRNMDLYISSVEIDPLKSRLMDLKNHGFVVTCINEVIVPGESQKAKLVLYSVTEDGRDLMNKKLKKRLKSDKFCICKQFDELLGQGAAATVVTKIMADPHFVDFDDAIFKGKFCGTVKLDCELNIAKDGIRYHVAVLSFFIHYDNRIMTEKDFRDYRYQKLNIIRDYLINKGSREGHKAEVICVCENNKDMHDMARLMVNSGGYEDRMYKSIHFTSESVAGTVRDIRDAFINIVPDGSEEGFSYEKACDFL